MNRKILVLIFLFILCFSLNSSVKDVFMHKSSFGEKSFITGSVSIGIVSSHKGVYKFKTGTRILNSGILREGLNYIHFKDLKLFSESGRHTYYIILKCGIKEFQRRIVIHSYVHEESDEGDLVAYNYRKQKHVCSVALFTDNEFLAKKIKKHKQRFTFKADGEPKAIEYGKFDALSGRFKAIDRASIPVLAIPVLLVKAIAGKKIRAGKAAKVKRIRYYEYKFLRENRQGIMKKKKIEFRIQSVAESLKNK